MNELQRAEYLSLLGVASYVPRYILPLAPKPRQAELPRESESGTARREAVKVPESAVEAAQQISSAERLAELGVVDSAAESKRADLQPQESAGADSAATQTEPAPGPFVLSCWWLGEELLAVDSREPGAALPVEVLFNNIALALGWHGPPSARGSAELASGE